MNLVSNESIVLVGHRAATHVGDGMVTTNDRVVAEGVSVAIRTTGSRGRGGTGVDDHGHEVGAGGNSVGLDGTLAESIRVGIIDQMHGKAIVCRGRTGSGDLQAVEYKMIGPIQFDHGTFACIGRREAELATVSVEGDRIGGGCTEYGCDDELFGVGAGRGVHVEDNGTIDTTLDIVIRIVEAGEIGSAGRLRTVDGKGSGNQTGCRYQNRGAVGRLAAVGAADNTSIISRNDLRSGIKRGSSARDVGPVDIVGRRLPLIRDAAGDGLSAQGQADVLTRTSENGTGGSGTGGRRSGTSGGGRPGKGDIGTSSGCTIFRSGSCSAKTIEIIGAIGMGAVE